MEKEYKVYDKGKLVATVGSPMEAVVIRSEYPVEEHHLITIHNQNGDRLTLTYLPFKVMGVVDLDGDGFEVDDVLGEFKTDTEAVKFMDSLTPKMRSEFVRVSIQVSTTDYYNGRPNQSDYYLKKYKDHLREE